MEPTRHLPRLLSMKIFVRLQILGQQTIEPWANRIRAILCLLHQLRRNNDIRIDRPEWDPDARSKVFTPAFRLAHRIFITYEERGMDVGEKSLMRLTRSPAHDKGDIALGQISFDIPQPLVQKNIVPQIR